jgi:hypothetical protein
MEDRAEAEDAKKLDEMKVEATLTRELKESLQQSARLRKKAKPAWGNARQVRRYPRHGGEARQAYGPSITSMATNGPTSTRPEPKRYLVLKPGATSSTPTGRSCSGRSTQAKPTSTSTRFVPPTRVLALPEARSGARRSFLLERFLFARDFRPARRTVPPQQLLPSAIGLLR